MSAKTFTSNYLNGLKSGAKQYDKAAAGRAGLIVRVFPSGQKSLGFRYKLNGSPNSKRYWFGSYPSPVSLEEGFRKWEQAREFVDKGIDPEEGFDAERRAHEAAKARAIEAAHFVPVRERYAEWMSKVIRPTRKRPDDVENKLGANMLPEWGERDPRTITKRDAGALFDKIIGRDAPAMANDVCSQAKQFFKWLAENDVIDANPITQTDPGGEEFARDRWLKPEELRAFIAALKQPATPISRRVRLALLLVLVTGQRSGEVVNLRWSELDLEKKIWRIPGDVVVRRRSAESGRKRNVKEWGKTKNGLEHVIPLSPLALAIIDELKADVVKQYKETQPYVVAGFKNERKANHVEDKALARALRNCIVVNKQTKLETLFGLEPFTPHDLRRTCTTLLSSLKVAPHIKKRILNHTDDDDVTEKVYDCWEYLDEKRDALDKWARMLLPIGDAKTPPHFVAALVERERPAQKGIAKPRRKAA